MNATQRNATAFLITLLMPTTVFADSIWPDSVCNTSSAYMLGNAQNRIVHVYVENDFAAELSSCTPTTDDDGKIAEDEVRHRIDEAIQKWNQQAVGLTFHYEGVLNAVDGPSACNMAGVQLPAVFVNFWKGCKKVGGACSWPLQVSGTATRHSTNCSSVTVWGDPLTLNACGAGSLNWSLRSDSGSPQILQSLLTHEFGHIAGLAHSNESCGTACTNDAVMNSFSKQYLHLRSWDKDCAETLDHDLFLGRVLNRRYMFHYNDGYTDIYYGTKQHDFPSRRGQVSSGALDIYYGLYDSSGFLDFDVAPTLGTSINFGNVNTISSEFLHAHVPPTFWSSYGTFAEPHRAFTLIEGSNNGTPPMHYDPPFVRESLSNNRFATTNTQWLRYQKPPSEGGTIDFVRTNLPVVTTYDSVSEQNIVVWVDTKHATRTNGEIHVHPGFSTAGLLAAGDVLAPSTTLPPDSTHPIAGYQWDLETDSIVGVACADEFWTLGYNCLLAWQDRGIPWGRILYTYFRVNSSNNIEWLGQAYIRGESRTSTGVQAAYKSNGFRMVWKGWLDQDQISEAYTRSGYTSWWMYHRSEERVVDSPTYFYRSHDPYPAIDKNIGITWTQAQP